MFSVVPWGIRAFSRHLLPPTSLFAFSFNLGVTFARKPPSTTRPLARNIRSLGHRELRSSRAYNGCWRS